MLETTFDKETSKFNFLFTDYLLPPLLRMYRKTVSENIFEDFRNNKQFFF